MLYLTQTKPPESYSLIRGVNENINMNSGTVNLDVPLFEITEGKFKLSNSLSYESRGFVPHITPGYVGLNWNMIQFGKITRESHRIDPTVMKILREPSLNGYAIQWNTVARPYMLNDCTSSSYGQGIYKKNILNDPANTDYSTLSTSGIGETYKNYTKNYEPDKFYFDFMGYKGYFIIDNEGKPLVYCENASLKISIESKCYNIFGNVAASQIVILDDKGNQYFFGGGLNELDINFSQSHLSYWNNDYIMGGNEMKRTNYIDSWLLKKIILTDGTIINGYYKPGNISLLNNYRGNGDFTNTMEPSGDIGTNFPSKTDLNAHNLVVKHSRKYDRSIDWWGGGTTIYTEVKSQLDTYTKEAILDSITVNDLTIHYLYIDTQNPLELTNKYLSEINVKKRNKLIKKINLNYEDYGLTNKRTFLNNIISSAGENVYFEYYHTDKFPPYNELLTNDLGYWNGIMTYNFSYYDAWNYTPLPEDFSVYDTGMIKKVVYPTRGYTTFIYEHGDFSKEYNIDFNTRLPVLINKTNTVNAPRLYKTIQNDIAGNNVETLYSYKNDDNASSGILDGVVTYMPNKGVAFSQSIKNLAPNLYSQNSLHYSNVKETVINKGYTKYKFSDRISNPDSSASKVYPGEYFNPYGWQNWDKINTKYLSKSNERGKLLKKEVYNNSDIKLKEITFRYSNFLAKLPNLDLSQNCIGCKVSDLNYYVYTSDHDATYIQSMYVPVVPYLLSSQITREYYGNDIVETTSSIGYLDKIIKRYSEGSSGSNDYIWYPYPKENKESTAMGTTIKKYIYPIDLYNENPCTSCSNDNTKVGGQYSTYQQLHYKNIFAPVVEIMKNSDNKFSLRENIFSPAGSSLSGAYAMKKVRTSLLNSPIDFSSYTIPVSQTEDGSVFDLYDNKVNLLQSTGKSGIPTTTIWGYNQTLPIATVEGGSYAEIMQAFGLNPSDNNSYLQLAIVNKSNLDIDDSSEATLISELNTFRSKAELKGFKVSTYTYNPMIGVTSITPPSGIRENYHYDSSNRLEKVIDITGKIIKEYKYNYAPMVFYNVAKSQSFTKNNCPAGMISTAYTYSVPAGQYTSGISQADADQQAQNDINTNGQNAANANSTCYYPYCEFNAQSSNSFFMVQYAPFQKANTVVNAQLNFQVTSNQGLNWSGGVLIGYIPSPCWPVTTISKTSGNWQITIYQGSGQTVLRWTGSGNPSTGTPYNITFNYNVN